MRIERPLTEPERALVAGMFDRAIDVNHVSIRRWRWWPFQPRDVTMAPMGHIHFASDSPAYRVCFGCSSLGAQAFFLHEMTHVWQAQMRGRWWLPLMRHPFCRYRYAFVPGRPFERYGIEQQASLVEHLHLLRGGVAVPGAPSREEIEAILPFGR